MGLTPGVTEELPVVLAEPVVGLVALDAAELQPDELPGAGLAAPDVTQEEALAGLAEPALLDGLEQVELPDAPLVQDGSRVSVAALDAVLCSDSREEALVQAAVRLDEVQDVTGVRDAGVAAARLWSPERGWLVFLDAQLAGNARAPLLRAALPFAWPLPGDAPPGLCT